MSHLITSQRDPNGRIARSFENLKKVGANNWTKGNVASRLETLRRNWARFEAQHDQLLVLASDPALVDDPYFRGEQTAATEEVFLGQEALLMDILDSTLTASERLHYLRDTLSGDAAILLRHLPVREEKFETAWKWLQDRYDNQRLMVRALATLKRPFDATCAWLVHLVAERLDPQPNRGWENHIAAAKIPPTFAEMTEFLEARVITVQAQEERCKGTEGCPPRPARSA